MKRILLALSTILLIAAPMAHADFFDVLQKGLMISGISSSDSLDNATIVKGLKEALATGTERAIVAVAKPDGYFGNQLIKILLPEKLQKTAEVLKEVGFREQVDDLVLSMNRAAEKAAPKAASFFGEAIRQMTLEDARGILNGGDTAATKFFEKKTRAKLFEAFRPSVSKSMDQVGTARAYKEMTTKLEALPFLSLAGGHTNLDLDAYVTEKALDGLFQMVAEEEKKIRTNPAARTTDLLRKVFGGK